MPFLPPNQQRQSTEGTVNQLQLGQKVKLVREPYTAHLSGIVGPLLDAVVVDVRVDPEQKERRVSGADDDRAASLRLLFATYRARPASTQLVERPRHQHVQVQVDTAVLQQHLQVHRAGITGAVVRERGGTPFRQIFWGRGTALRQISLATAGGTLTPKSSGKSSRTRWVDPRSVYFLALIAPKRAIWHQKSPKKN